MQNDQNNNDYIKEFAKDPAIFDVCENIGKKFGLFIDQVGDLDMEVRNILLGKSKSEDLINNLSRVLEINKSSAGQIVEEINKQIFSTLKSKMQNQSTYVTSLGNTQMNANTYPQSFRPINNTTPQPAPTVTESPHADLEKAGGFTIEVAGNPTPNIEKPKPQPVEIPKTQQPLQPNPPKAEIKTETISQPFKPTDYYNFRNNQETKVEDKKEEAAEKEVTNQKEEVVEKENEIEDKPKTEEKEVYGTEEKTIVPGKIVFKHVQDTEIKPEQKTEPKIEAKNEEIIKPIEKIEPVQDVEPKNPEIETKETIEPIEKAENTDNITETKEVETKKPLADYLVSKMNDKSTVPDNLPVEEAPKPIETVKETVVPPIVNEVKLAPAPKPVIENKPRAFDPYREIPN